MISITDKSKCCGCSACSSVCPKKCIFLVPDQLGFLYPKVDEKECIDCHCCENVCPIISTHIIKDDIHCVYGAINNSTEIRSSSSSGGVFTAIADYVLKQGGIVFGAEMTDGFHKLRHTSTDSVEKLDAYRSSKYLQSYLGQSFKEIKEYLKKGKIVLFSGTPCQISGLKSYLYKDYENLYTVDFVCHGVPSPAVWDKYIGFLENKYKSKPKYVTFRHKTPGQLGYSLKIVFENEMVFCEKSNVNVYLRGFAKNEFLREACFDCKFKGLERVSDITLADFWGVKDYFPQYDDASGVSLSIIHTPKGKRIFDNIKEKLNYVETDDQPLVKNNSCSIKSVVKPVQYDSFQQEFVSEDFVKLMNRRFGVTLMEKVKKTIYKIVRG